MPGYGVREDAVGLLSWREAEARFRAYRNYWLVTVRPDGRPHAMPVWGVWDGDFWFSSGGRSRKLVNLLAEPRVVVAGDDTEDPVVVEGVAQVARDPAEIARFLDRLNAKYATSYAVDFLDPEVNATVRMRPTVAFGLRQADFSGSPTRWSWPVRS